jgi:hypothetical protein
LNGEFYDTLPAHVQSRMLEVLNQNPDNPHHCIAGGSPTYDKVFLLSIDEAMRYFTGNDDRAAEHEGAGGRWWLRSPGAAVFYAVYVCCDGNVDTHGSHVDFGADFGVRPALWLRL